MIHFHANLPIFDRNNKDKWFKKMKVIFVFHVYGQVINNVESLLVNPSTTHKTIYKDAKKKDSKTLFFIHQCVYTKVFEKIVEYANSKNVWDILVKNYKCNAKFEKVRSGLEETIR